MPQKLYTVGDLRGLPVVNAQDPVNVQDLATKRYNDDFHNRLTLYQSLWEADYSMQNSGGGTYTNGTTHLTNGPKDQTITKQFPETAIRITGMMTLYINTIGAQIRLKCSVNNSAQVEVCGLYMSTVSEHTALPLGIVHFLGGAGNLLGNAVGNMTVAWYLYVSSASTTVYTDTNDYSAWTMAECRSG